MKKLKIILPLSIFLIIYVIFSINNKPASKYSINDKQIEGYIYDCQVDDNKTVFKIKGKENILIHLL